MSGLIERIEAAGGPDRELDRDIMIAAVPCDRAPFRYWAPVNEGTGYGVVDVERVYYAPHCAQAVAVPHFTASIDAATSLVPQGWRKWMLDADNGDGLCQLEHLSSDQEVHTRVKTLALAVCAAALKARETTPSIKGGDRG